jgi:glutathione S-transferase
MKLYGFAFAPNPRKTFTYLREKGIDFEYVHVNLPGGEHREDWFRAKNPMTSLPVLELDDGTCLTESLPIIEYVEETHPDPPMIGTSPRERHRTRELERLAEMSILMRVGRVFRNSSQMFAGPQHIPELARTAQAELPGVLAILDDLIGTNEFVAGDRPTIADCTLFAALKLAETGGVEIDPAAGNVARWWESFSRRPSAADPPMG